MQPRIETLSEKKFIGSRITMSLSENKTYELWRSFMPRRNEVTNNISTALFSIEVYPPQYFDPFNPTTKFEKWAAVEVKDDEKIPNQMESIVIPEGLYAVFVHHGPASAAPQTYQYIFGTWLPDSDFLLDNRPHFAIMDEKYKHEDSGSEEELWIPVKARYT